MKISRRMLTLAVCLMTNTLVCVTALRSGRADELRGMLAINEDNGHFFGYKKPEEMNVGGLQAWVDQYAGGAVTHLFLCPNAMRASFRSKSRDAIWDPYNGKIPDHPWPRNAKGLHDAGIDPYKVWIARCRRKKISPWLSMRMNDVHNTEDRDNFQHSTFWRKNIHLWREPNHEHGSGLNYAYAEVRAYQMAFVRELLERYDPDGLELDWMRFPNHLTPGKARQERGFLTEFVREVRSLTNAWSKKRGHRILLGVRAPALPDAGAGTGMDAVAWAREGLVDLIVATPFYFSTDFDIPFELWRERLQDAPEPVTVIGGVDSTARPWISGTPVGNTMETLRGFAASSYHRGSHGVYLFNWMDDTQWPVPTTDYKRLLRDGVGPDVAAQGARRYPVCFHDTVPEGASRNEQLPADARTGKTFRIHIGPKPTSGKAWAIAGFAKRDGLVEARFEAKLNGQRLPAVEDLKATKSLGGESARAVRFVCPLDTLQAGYNELHLAQAAGSSGQQIVWLELRVEPSN